jgi:hypothetical protein
MTKAMGLRVGRCVFLIGLVALGAARGFAAEDLRQKISVRTALAKKAVLVGEPILITTSLVNESKEVIKTPYSDPETFASAAQMTVTVAKDGKVLSTARVPPFVGSLVISDWKSGGDEWALKPGQSVKRMDVVCPVTEGGGQRQWLVPGAYKVRVDILFQGLPGAAVQSQEEDLTINPITENASGFLSLWKPGLAELLELRRSPAQEDQAVALTLKDKFPKSPQRVYLEYALLASEACNGDASCRPRLERYLSEYPESPFVPDVLFYLGYWEKRSEGRAAQAKTYFQRILKDFPESKRAKKAAEYLAQIEAYEKLSPNIQRVAPSSSSTVGTLP